MKQREIEYALALSSRAACWRTMRPSGAPWRPAPGRFKRDVPRRRRRRVLRRRTERDRLHVHPQPVGGRTGLGGGAEARATAAPSPRMPRSLPSAGTTFSHNSAVGGAERGSPGGRGVGGAVVIADGDVATISGCASSLTTGRSGAPVVRGPAAVWGPAGRSPSATSRCSAFPTPRTSPSKAARSKHNETVGGEAGDIPDDVQILVRRGGSCQCPPPRRAAPSRVRSAKRPDVKAPGCRAPSYPTGTDCPPHGNRRRDPVHPSLAIITLRSDDTNGTSLGANHLSDWTCEHGFFRLLGLDSRGLHLKPSVFRLVN